MPFLTFSTYRPSNRERNPNAKATVIGSVVTTPKDEIIKMGDIHARYEIFHFNCFY